MPVLCPICFSIQNCTYMYYYAHTCNYAGIMSLSSCYAFPSESVFSQLTNNEFFLKNAPKKNLLIHFWCLQVRLQVFNSSNKPEAFSYLSEKKLFLTKTALLISDLSHAHINKHGHILELDWPLIENL